MATDSLTPIANPPKARTDRRERAQAHPQDLKTDEIGHSLYELGSLEVPAIHADESQFLGQAAHDRLRLRVIGTQNDGDAMRGQTLPVEFDDFGGYGIKRLDDTSALRVGGEALGKRGNRRGEMNAGTVIRIGNIKSQYGAVVAVDHNLASERLRLSQQARWKYIAHGVKHHAAVCLLSSSLYLL